MAEISRSMVCRSALEQVGTNVGVVVRLRNAGLGVKDEDSASTGTTRKPGFSQNGHEHLASWGLRRFT